MGTCSRPIEQALEGGFRGSWCASTRQAASRRCASSSTRSISLLAMFLAHVPRVLRRHRPAREAGCSPMPKETSGRVPGHGGDDARDLHRLLVVPGGSATCLVACPYGRLQTVLFDRDSLIVIYDPARGRAAREGTWTGPRAGRLHRLRHVLAHLPDRHRHPGRAADGMRHCTQCIDACDEIMTNIGKPIRPDPLRLEVRARRQTSAASCARASCSTDRAAHQPPGCSSGTSRTARAPK